SQHADRRRDQEHGNSEPLVPIAAVAVIAVLFWFRPVEGLLAFGLFTLLADTIEHWLQLDVLLFDEIGLLALAAVAAGSRRVVRQRLRVGWLELSVVVLAIAGILSSLVNGVPLQTWAAGLFLLLKGIAFFGLVRLLPLRVADAERLGVAVLLVAAAIGVLGFVESLDPAAFQAALGLPLYEQSRGEVPIIKAVFLHPAQFGWLTAYGSLLCYARFITHRSWWAIPAGLMLNLATFLSGRRTPLLGVVASVAVGLVWWTARAGLRRALLHIWLPAAAVVIVLALVAAPAVQRLADVTVAEYGPSLDLAGEIFADEPRSELIANIHPRVGLYAASVAIVRDELPFGGGLGRFGSHLSRAEYSPLYERYGLDEVRLLRPEDPQAATDAFWPMVLGETGLTGALAAVAIFGGMAVLLWRAASGAGSAALRTITLAGLFVVIEGLIRSATSSVYVAPPIGYFVLGTAGVALAVAASEAERVRDTIGND
ncbi:MAG: hypothetical protein M3Y40_04330, partial [Chloroflexota bacterium]|nr:hypothetical protein [Chloroflexota bacterium]